MKYWLFNMDPYFMVYDLIPTSLGSISSPIHPNNQGPFFHCSFLRQKNLPRLAINEPPLEPLKATFRKDWMPTWRAIPVTLCQTNIFENKPSWEKKFIFQSNQKKQCTQVFMKQKEIGHRFRPQEISDVSHQFWRKSVEVSRKLLSNENENKNRFGNIHQFFTNPGFPRWQTSGNYKGTHTDTVTWMLRLEYSTWRILPGSKYLVPPSFTKHIHGHFGISTTPGLDYLQSPFLFNTYKSWDDPPTKDPSFNKTSQRPKTSASWGISSPWRSSPKCAESHAPTPKW